MSVNCNQKNLDYNVVNCWVCPYDELLISELFVTWCRKHGLWIWVNLVFKSWHCLLPPGWHVPLRNMDRVIISWRWSVLWLMKTSQKVTVVISWLSSQARGLPWNTSEDRTLQLLEDMAGLRSRIRTLCTNPHHPQSYLVLLKIIHIIQNHLSWWRCAWCYRASISKLSTVSEWISTSKTKT